jgi:hypothetical protein
MFWFLSLRIKVTVYVNIAVLDVLLAKTEVDSCFLNLLFFKLCYIIESENYSII